MEKCKYPDGTAAIQLQPDELAQLNALRSDPAAYRQALWQMIGYTPQKYPAGSDGAKQQMNMYNNAVDYVNQGYRPFTKTKANGSIAQGYTKMYSQGALGIKSLKPIEVEKDELIFCKEGDKFKLKADFKGGKTHKEGGEDYTASGGDVIFPSEMRDKVMKMYESGDHSGLEKLRQTLPQDKQKSMYDDGTKGIGYNYNPNYPIGYNGQVPYINAPYQQTSDGYNPNWQQEIDAYLAKSHYNPQYASSIRQSNNIADVNKAANAAVLGYDASQSIDQMHRSNQAIKGLHKPSQIAPIDKNPLLQRELYLAKMRASQGMSGQQKDFANFQGLDNFMKSKDIAATSSAGQASGYGSAMQKAVLDRYKYGIQNNILNDQIRQQNQGAYNNMIGQSMNENNNIRSQKMVNYADSLNQYNQRQAAAQHLGQTGRVNMRKSIGDARELAPTYVPGYGYQSNPYAYNNNTNINVTGNNQSNLSPSIYNDPEINNIVNSAISNTSQRYTPQPVPQPVSNDPQIDLNYNNLWH